MKANKVSIFIAAALLIAGSATAGSISCGDSTISDDQDEGQTSMQILEQCGEPTSRNGNDWLYDRSDVGEGIYVLHFNGASELESIDEEELMGE